MLNWAGPRVLEMLAGCRILMKSDLQSKLKRRNYSLDSKLHQQTKYGELYLTTDTLRFFVDKANLWSGAQCLYM